jgi:LPS export ABC transporter protein LptC
MNIDRVRIRQLMVFALLALGSYAVYETWHSEDSGFTYEPFTKGYSIEGVVIRNSDEDGRIVSTITAPSVIHYADSGRTVINQPSYRMHQEAGDWVFSSATGEINQSQTQLYFPNEVLLELDVAEQDKVSVNTSELTVNLDQQTGSSPEKLTVTQPGVLLQGMGSLIRFKQQEIEILEDVYAEFEG